MPYGRNDQVEPGAVDCVADGVLAVGEDVGGVVVGEALGVGPLETVNVMVLPTCTSPGGWLWLRTVPAALPFGSGCSMAFPAFRPSEPKVFTASV